MRGWTIHWVKADIDIRLAHVRSTPRKRTFFDPLDVHEAPEADKESLHGLKSDVE